MGSILLIIENCGIHGIIVHIVYIIQNLAVIFLFVMCYFQIQGIITRHNLTHEYLEERMAELKDMQDLNTLS